MTTTTEDRYAPYASPLDAVMTYEEEGVESLEDAVAVARAILDTNLHNSAGRYGRFVSDVIDALYDNGLTKVEIQAVLSGDNEPLSDNIEQEVL